MATSADSTHLSDLHMLVLVALAVYGSGDADAIAGWLDLPVALASRLPGASTRPLSFRKRRRA
jgi:hypothetical protein